MHTSLDNTMKDFIDPKWPESVREICEEFVVHRKEMKCPLTVPAARRFKRRIEHFLAQKYTASEIVHAIDKTICNGWRDIFLPELNSGHHRERLLTQPEKYWDMYTEEERQKFLNS